MAIFKFGSMNMNIFGNAASSNRDLNVLADIIISEDYDVVALQEIFSQGKAVESLMRLLPRMKYVIASSGSVGSPEGIFTNTNDHRGEVYSYLWNPRTVKLATSSTDHGKRVYQPRGVNRGSEFHVDDDKFARSPYYARFYPKIGGYFEFRLISVHLYSGDTGNGDDVQRRKDEYNYIVKEIYPMISQYRKYGNFRTAYTVVMGDYNLNIYKSPAGKRDVIEDDIYMNGKQIIRTIQSEPTTISTKQDLSSSNDMFVNNYDHFTIDQQMLNHYGIYYSTYRVDTIIQKYYGGDHIKYTEKISNHLPITLELAMNEYNSMSIDRTERM